jgi:NADH dehydrogenase
MTHKLVTVFGGAGFLGRHVVRALCRDGWRVRVAMRRPHLGGDVRLAGDVGQVQLVQANVRNPDSITRALEGATAVVNLVAIGYESGPQSFTGVNFLGARNVAQACAAAGIETLIYMSSIGVDRTTHAAYARTKLNAERATLEAVPTATLLRPSILFGQEDGFFTRFAEMARLTPVLPLIGGSTKFQPVYVADVAAAVAAAVKTPAARGQTYELGGPRAYTMKALLKYITATIDRRRLLLPLPTLIAAPLGYLIGALSRANPFFGPPLTGDQVQMLQIDNVVGPNANTFADLGITSLETVESIVPTYLWRHRPYGQFQAAPEADLTRADI